ncbi:MAG: SGNH/GDSL hydrolase family protein [Bdellovibrionota bacterium]
MARTLTSKTTRYFSRRCLWRFQYRKPVPFQAHHKSLTGLLANRYPSRGIEFINVAFAGYTTAHSLVLLNLHVQSWNPDLLVIAHNFNDLTTMYYPNYAVDYSHFLNLPYFQKSQYTHPLARVLSQFRLTQSLAQKVRNPVHFSKETKIPFEAGAQVYRRNLESFLAIAHKEKVPVVVLSEPIREDREAFIKVMSHQPYAESATFPPFEQILEHHRAFNKIALSYAGRTQVFGLDTAKHFAGNAEWFSDFIHPSEKGLEVLASSLGDFLDDTKLLPGAKPLRTVQLR